MDDVLQHCNNFTVTGIPRCPVRTRGTQKLSLRMSASVLKSARSQRLPADPLAQDAKATWGRAPVLAPSPARHLPYSKGRGKGMSLLGADGGTQQRKLRQERTPEKSYTDDPPPRWAPGASDQSWESRAGQKGGLRASTHLHPRPQPAPAWPQVAAQAESSQKLKKHSVKKPPPGGGRRGPTVGVVAQIKPLLLRTPATPQGEAGHQTPFPTQLPPALPSKGGAHG